MSGDDRTTSRSKRRAAVPIVLAPAPKRFTADGGHRTCTPQETLARLEPLVGPIAGIVPDIEKVPAPADMHVYHCTQVFDGRPIDPRANRVLGRPAGAAGKGASDLQARASCLAEAVERYSCGLFGDEKRQRARIGETAGPAVDPRSLLLFSDRQYREREAANRIEGRGFNWVPERFDAGRAIDWSPAWSLTQGRESGCPPPTATLATGRNAATISAAPIPTAAPRATRSKRRSSRASSSWSNAMPARCGGTIG